jgi:hypothetical protein
VEEYSPPNRYEMSFGDDDPPLPTLDPPLPRVIKPSVSVVKRSQLESQFFRSFAF